MQNNNLKKDTKTYVIVSFATGSLIILFSLIGHFITPTKLIPSSFIGGTIGLSSGVFLCFRKGYIAKESLLPVLLCSLISYGVVASVTVFNLNNPLLIVSCFSIIGFTTVICNNYFSLYCHHSLNKIYSILGLVLSFPAVYFVIASILKFQLGVSLLFNFFDTLLSRPNGQANFNAITPFLFAGGLMLAFGINLFPQFKISGTNTGRFTYRSLNLKLNANLMIVMVTCLTALTILSYLAAENL